MRLAIIPTTTINRIIGKANMRFSCVRILGAALAAFGIYLIACLLTSVDVSPRRDVDGIMCVFWIVAVVSLVVGLWIFAFRKAK